MHMFLYIPCALLLVDLTCNLSGLLTLLKIDLENMVPMSRSEFSFEDNDSCDDIKALVVSHQMLLRFLLLFNIFLCHIHKTVVA